MMKRKNCLCTLVGIVLLGAAFAQAKSIPVVNGSFETPVIDPEGFPVITIVSGWDEQDTDLDPEYFGRNTGIFLNPPVGAGNRVVNADGSQLAFLGGWQGIALSQTLAATYQIGRQYRLTVGACLSISEYFPYPAQFPLILAFYYIDNGQHIDILTAPINPSGLSTTFLTDFSITLPAVKTGDAWLGKNIGIAVRGSGTFNGMWDLDNVRLTELGGDITGDEVVNLADFAILAEYWLDTL